MGTIGGLVVGKAYVAGKGIHLVEQTDSPDHFRLRSVLTGRSRYTHRDSISWRK